MRNPCARCRRLRANTRRTRRTLASSRSWGSKEACRQAAVAHASGRPEDVPEDLVRAVALVGEPVEARERLEGYREAGADLPVVYPVATPSDPIGSVARTLIAAVPV